MDLRGLLITYAIIFAVLVVAAFAAAYAYRRLRERRLRRALVALVGRKESLLAAERALKGLLIALCDAPDAALERFACDPTSEDRRAFGDLADRMAILADELSRVEHPSVLDPMVEQMVACAREMAEAAASAAGRGPIEALDAVSAVDLGTISAHVRETDARLHALATAHGVDDPAVYGGGLYI
jgi:hypothetical protein